MQHFLISKDPSIYQAFPDLALTSRGMLICVFLECTHHHDRGWTHIAYRTSNDRGRTWSKKRSITQASVKKETGYLWNCPRVMVLPDGRVALICDRPSSEEMGSDQPNFMWISADDGETWGDGIALPVTGIVPDRLVFSKNAAGKIRWHLTAQSKIREGDGEVWSETTWVSDDDGVTWLGPFTIAAVSSLKLCEASLFQIPSGEIICLFRENSFRGLPAYKSVSRDGGITWSGVVEFPLPGCHRPVGGMLASGRVLITFRLMQGGKGGMGWWTQNFMAGLTSIESCLAEKQTEVQMRIMPIAYDRSPKADIGYSGWVQFSDDEIYIAYYLVDDHGRGHIRGCSLRENDMLLDS